MLDGRTLIVVFAFMPTAWACNGIEQTATGDDLGVDTNGNDMNWEVGVEDSDGPVGRSGGTYSGELDCMEAWYIYNDGIGSTSGATSCEVEIVLEESESPAFHGHGECRHRRVQIESIEGALVDGDGVGTAHTNECAAGTPEGEFTFSILDGDRLDIRMYVEEPPCWLFCVGELALVGN